LIRRFHVDGDREVMGDFDLGFVGAAEFVVAAAVEVIVLVG